MTDAADSPLPLADVTVLELGHIIAGPFCSLVLADLGARVIKVEHPEGGDVVRNSSPLGNSSFNYVNRDKESVTLDLKTDDGTAVFEDLLDAADVVVENYKPGTADRLGVGYDELRARKPDLIYCSIKGFNPGPYESFPALDPVAEAMSGLMSVTGHEGQPPVRSGTSVSDMTASLYGTIAVVAALRHRDATGDGQHVTAPLFESTVALMGYWLSFTQAYDEVPRPLGAGHPNWAPYDVFETADDGWVFVGPSNQHQWEALCDALDAPLYDEERYATLDARRRNADDLTDDLQAVIGTFREADLLANLREAGVPTAPVNDTRDVCADPHLAATDMFATVRATEGERVPVRVPRFPVESTEFDRIDSTDPPQLGEDTDAVLASLGYSMREIDDLRERGVI